MAAKDTATHEKLTTKELKKIEDLALNCFDYEEECNVRLHVRKLLSHIAALEAENAARPTAYGERDG